MRITESQLKNLIKTIVNEQMGNLAKSDDNLLTVNRNTIPESYPSTMRLIGDILSLKYGPHLYDLVKKIDDRGKLYLSDVKTILYCIKKIREEHIGWDVTSGDYASGELLDLLQACEEEMENLQATNPEFFNH